MHIFIVILQWSGIVCFNDIKNKDFFIAVVGLRRKGKHLPHSSDFFLHSKSLGLSMFQCCCEVKGVLYGGCDVASWDEITCTECLLGGR